MSFLKPKPPTIMQTTIAPVAPPPTIDEAGQRDDEFRRLARRRGRRALMTGAGNAAPSVAQRALLG